MRLRFEVLDSESGVFCYPEKIFDALIEEFDAVLDAREEGELADKAYATALQQLIAAEPELVDAHAHLSFAWYRQGKPKKALDAALAGLAVANRLIPEGFTGRIEWGHIENRPFLRALQGAMLAHVRLRRHRDAVVLIEKMLAYNPNDNQGVRYLLGSEALRDGDVNKARRVFLEAAGSYPPYSYELGLSHLLDGEWVAAATALRRGFFTNFYIAEVLNGNPEPTQLPVWHGSSHEHPEEAIDYSAMYGRLWRRFPDLLVFVRWLFNHPRVLAERAAVMACRDEMQWEREPAAHRHILDRMQRLYAGIDDTLSAAIIVKRSDRSGQQLYPWAMGFSM